MQYSFCTPYQLQDTHLMGHFSCIVTGGPRGSYPKYLESYLLILGCILSLSHHTRRLFFAEVTEVTAVLLSF